MACKNGGCGVEPPWYRILVDNNLRLRSTVNWLLLVTWGLGTAVIILQWKGYGMRQDIKALTARVEALECPEPQTNLPEPPPAPVQK